MKSMTDDSTEIRIIDLLSGKSAWLFDLDGVLIDSESEYTRIWRKINDCFPTGVSDFAIKIKGTTLDKILNDNYPDADIRAQVVKMLYEEEQRIVYRYCDGARDLLEFMRIKEMPHALVTSSNEYKMGRLYEAIPEFRNFFSVIIDSSKVSRSKPDPEGYLKAASELGVRAQDCIVVEDSVQGVKAGKSAGAYVIGMAGTVGREALQPYADIVIDSLSELF